MGLRVPGCGWQRRTLFVLEARLRRAYGEKVAIIYEPDSPKADRLLYCEMAAAFYREALALPDSEERIKVIRYLLWIDRPTRRKVQ
jgi:hypothetical protein